MKAKALCSAHLLDAHSGLIRTSGVVRLNASPHAAEPCTLHPPPYRGTSIIRNSAPLGPYSRNMPRALCLSLTVLGPARASDLLVPRSGIPRPLIIILLVEVAV